MWMKKNYNPKNFAGMLLRIKIGRMKLYFVLLMKSHLQLKLSRNDFYNIKDKRQVKSKAFQ